MATAATQNAQSAFLSNHQSSIHSQSIPAPQTSTTPSNKSPRNVQATLNFFLPNADGSPPAPAYVGRPETYFRPSEPHIVTIHDIRGSEDAYSLDTTGFQIVKHESAEKKFEDEEKIKEVYYGEIEEILKKATGANRVFIFDHTIRRPNPSGTGETALLRGPVQRVHIDQSYRAGPERVKHHLPAEAEELLKHRYQIINVWRPIKTIKKDPLAIADARSVKDSELVPIGLIYPDRDGETYSVKYAEGQKWYYGEGLRPEEVLLIKCFDSVEKEGWARRVPHSAFVDEEREGEEGRESIEVRALVFGGDVDV
ncbi:hypothetical protein BGZ60DRAFT_487313 [Tricladium varicosporioides]|nr:hypothetical protein BGZ60DRAFT_487313 [Hymenoscyphus varicosporioides]